MAEELSRLTRRGMITTTLSNDRGSGEAARIDAQLACDVEHAGLDRPDIARTHSHELFLRRQQVFKRGLREFEEHRAWDEGDVAFKYRCVE